jgi:membrane-associated phospholipid phosphatase
VTVLNPPRLRPPRLVPLAIALVGGIGFAVIYVAAVLTHRGQAVENRALSGAGYGTNSRELLGLVTIPNIAIALLVTVAIALARRNVRAALRVVTVVGASNVLAQLLKYTVLTRPDLADSAAANTFPSGHTVAWASVAIGFLLVLPAVARPVVAFAGAALVSIVAFQLLAYGWHRASDVIGGLLLVLALAALAVLVIPDIPRPAAARGASGMITFGLLAAGFALGVLALGALTALFALDGDLASERMLLLSSQVLCVTVVLGTFAAALLLVQRGPRSR